MSERRMREIHDATTCAVAACADLIGTKWTSMVVKVLAEAGASDILSAICAM